MPSTAGRPERREVVVGRIGKVHGIRGELSVEPRTDEPDRRFAEGAVLRTQTPRGSAPHGADRPATLTVRTVRWHQSRLLVAFEEVDDRTAAEALRGLTLVTDVDPAEAPDDPDEFYDHQLVGLAVATTDGRTVGEVIEVLHGSGQDLLAIRTAHGTEVLVPFVSALVPLVDVRGGRVEVVDRPGLLDPEQQA
ncbi:MAG: ribosome maturation factor RimM [Nocardioidaceae bacterium]|nr:ribosome maturation factor RimM [Nocardioidaceae bacterium]NUS52190.1 ribosome maturation factor RimM [Nocardioidaceae bacterium]